MVLLSAEVGLTPCEHAQPVAGEQAGYRKSAGCTPASMVPSMPSRSRIKEQPARQHGPDRVWYGTPGSRDVQGQDYDFIKAPWRWNGSPTSHPGQRPLLFLRPLGFMKAVKGSTGRFGRTCRPHALRIFGPIPGSDPASPPQNELTGPDAGVGPFLGVWPPVISASPWRGRWRWRACGCRAS